jgi:hypothetical protein
MVNNVNKPSNHLSPQLIEHRKIPRHLTLEIEVRSWILTLLSSIHNAWYIKNELDILQYAPTALFK